MIKLQPLEEDWIDANRLHMRWTRDQWLTRGLGMAILALAGLLLLANDTLPEPVQMVGVMFLVLPVSNWIVAPLLGLVIVPGRARRLFRQTKTASDAQEIAWDADAITFTAADWTQKARWSDYAKWRENEKLFLLYINNMSFRIIPKRAFQNPAALAEFAALMRAKVVSGHEKTGWRNEPSNGI